jgi:hypothetical protein
VRGIYYFPKRLYSRLLAARDKTTPPVILGALACDVHEEVRLGVAGNPATPKCVWVILLEDPNSSVRAEVAARQDVEHEHLIKLAQDKSETVWKVVSTRDDICEDVLRILVEKTLPIRIQLASKLGNAPEWLSVKLARDKETRVRVLVAASSSSDVALNILRNDQELIVQDTILARVFDREASEARRKNYGRRAFAW